MRRWLCAILALMLAPVSVQAQPDLDPRTLAKEMLPRLAEAFPGASFAQDEEDPLVVRMEGYADWDDVSINLHRIWEFCRNNPSDACEQTKIDFLSGISTPPDEAQRDTLRVIVRDAVYVEYLLEASAGAEGFDLPMRQIGEDLFALIASDSPNAISVATQDIYTDLGLTEEEAWALATRQTKAIIPDLPTAKQLSESMVVYADMEYLPGLLIDAEAWDAIAKEVGPSLYMFAVNDYLLAFGTSEGGEDLDALRDLVAQECRMAARCLSPHVYRRVDGQWVIAR